METLVTIIAMPVIRYVETHTQHNLVSISRFLLATVSKGFPFPSLMICHWRKSLEGEPLYWHTVFTWLGSYHPKTSPSCIVLAGCIICPHTTL